MTDSTTSIPILTDSIRFVAIDIETTGLSAERDEIIEIAAIRFDAGKVTAKYDSFVKPKKGLPKFIEYLTHISPADLKNAPPPLEVLKEFRDFIGDSILVGHNISFDLGFINHNLVKNGELPLINKYWDTVELSRVFFPFTNDHKLATMVDHFGINLANAHRADADAEATGLLLNQIADYVIRHFPLMLNARLLDLAKQASNNDGLDSFLAILVEYQRRYSLVGTKTKLPQNDLHNIIENQVSDIPITVNQVFGVDGLFAQRFSNYEIRNGQIDMANKVQQAFDNLEHLVIEAGTGVGKSFAYLVPALRFALASGSKVVVSTNTKNLQEQLFCKDLPQLKDMVPISFKAVLVKGRENYVCERRWEELLLEQTRGITTYEAQALLYLLIWKQLSHTGDVSENSSFDKSRFSIVWRKICSDRYLCMNRKCHNFNKCHVMALRKHIESASIVIVNHSLLLADLKSENATLGEYQHLIVDEAHNLMASASKHLGFDVTYADLINLFNQLASPHKKHHTGFVRQLKTNVGKSLLSEAAKEQTANICKNIEDLTEQLRKPVTALFISVGKQVDIADKYGKLRIKVSSEAPELFASLQEVISGWRNLMKELKALSNVMSSFNSKLVPNYDLMSESMNAFEMRAYETEGELLTLLNPDLDNYAMWLENNPKPDRNIPSSAICYAPIEVNLHLNNILYKNIPCIVFTSATLALRGSFKYFMGQSGLSLVEGHMVREVIVESPFDYQKQTKLLIASFLPEHKDKFYLNQALSCLEQIVTSTHVGTMILFTSYFDLNNVYNHLGDTLYHNNRPFFAQGKGGSRSSMLNEFKRNNNGVLLGTNSFWEGVDVQGESLSLLILYKLPFQVPSEPLVEAYIDKLERENHDSFMHYMLPNALLKLRQGFGRLIRSKSDNGIVLIMDSRVSNKRYGEFFKQVLPATCSEIRDPLQLTTEISNFFSKI
ncbi:MAG: DNA polymerase III subunit epsilon [Candidatus Cloacimonetes bacterium HGW-Cloacimonetes-1]|jgi:predicted DnaQ family exonuclease/DinG family helicase|nr:MAG: DNA polymerase III subunit epsilon [Candidatus Cloacimonetes bacterium HGW-Cloacimonetes-1]